MHQPPRRIRNSGRGGGHYRHSRRENSLWSFWGFSKRDLGPSVQNVSLKSLKPVNSKWDKQPALLKELSASKAKAAGLFSGPGAALDSKLTSAAVEQTLAKYVQIEGKSVEDSMLTPLHSSTSRAVILQVLDGSSLSLEVVETYLAKFLSSLQLNISKDDLKFKLKKNKYNEIVIETSKSIVATVLMSLHLKKIDEFGGPIILKRPFEYIPFDDPLEKNDSISNRIIESPHLLCVNNLLDGQKSREDWIKLLHNYGQLQSLSVLTPANDDKTENILFFAFKSNEDSTSVIISKIKEKEDIDAFQVCKNTKNDYLQKVRFTYGNIKQLVNSKTPEITKHAETKMIQLLNMLTIDDLMDESKYNGLVKILNTDFGTYLGFQKLTILRPNTKPLVDEMNLQWGKVFVLFDCTENATKCLLDVCGRSFCNRAVVGGYIDEHDFDHLVL